MSEKRCTFATETIVEEYILMSDNKITREEVLKRWATSKAKKRMMVERMKEMLYDDY